jgi:hypothetical protein
MGYLQDVDRWLDELLPDVPPESDVKRQIKEKILESYRNGLQGTGRSPAPLRTTRPRGATRGQR